MVPEFDRSPGHDGKTSDVTPTRSVPKLLSLVALGLLTLLWRPPDAVAQCFPATGEVAFFEHGDFRGRCATRAAGDYPRAGDIGLGNDSISSIRTGSNAQTLVCEHTFFGGRCELFTGSDASLSDNAIRNDRISSARIQSRGAPVACVPGAGQAAFFQHSDFQGACTVRNLGNYPRDVDIGVANDTISSIRVGGNAQAFVCEHTFYEGRCELLAADDPNLGDNGIGHDRISSVKVQSRGTSTACIPGPSQVAFFQHSSFGGACEVRGIGDYVSPLAIGLQNDTLSSVRVGADAQAVLCRDAGFGGDCQRFTSDDPSLGNNRIGHDSVSSAKVQARGHLDCLPGPGQVALFAHSGFLAPCQVKDMGSYAHSGLIGLANDSISSVRVGADAQAVLCRDSGFGGDCQRFTTSDSSLGNNRIGHDSISSAKVQPRGFRECQHGPDEVAFFVHGDFTEPCVVRGPGDYASSSAIGLEDDSISSITVGANVQACACSDEEFASACEAFEEDDRSLGNNFPILGGGHDIISSARVQPRGAACQAAPPPPPPGVSQLVVFNCNSAMREVHLWTRDLTESGPFVERGSLSAQWSGGSCPNGASPFTIPLTDGHLFQFVAVDPDLLGCNGQNNPQASLCQRLILTEPVPGDDDGPRLAITVN